MRDIEGSELSAANLSHWRTGLALATRVGASGCRQRRVVKTGESERGKRIICNIQNTVWNGELG